MNLLRPAVRCPGCGKPPPLRIPEAERLAALEQPGDAVKVTIQCPRKGCGHVYEVLARAYQFAS